MTVALVRATQDEAVHPAWARRAIVAASEGTPVAATGDDAWPPERFEPWAPLLHQWLGDHDYARLWFLVQEGDLKGYALVHTHISVETGLTADVSCHDFLGIPGQLLAGADLLTAHARQRGYAVLDLHLPQNDRPCVRRLERRGWQVVKSQYVHLPVRSAQAQHLLDVQVPGAVNSEIRWATKDHVPRLTDLMCSLLEFEQLEHSREQVQQRVSQRLQMSADSGGYLVLVVDDELVGATNLTFPHELDGTRPGVIFDFVVDGKQRHVGLGTLLTQGILRIMRERGYDHICGEVDYRNALATKFWEQHVAGPDAFWLNTVPMMLRL